MNDFEQLKVQIDENREFFFTGKRLSVAKRCQLLKRLRDEVVKNRDRLVISLYDDLGKCETEALMSEFLPLLNSIDYIRRRVRRFSRCRRVGVSIVNFPASGRLQPEPYGQVLVISTWNYPLLMALDPVVGAIAAGNKVILKQSPLSTNTASVVAEIVENVFVNNEVITAGRNVDYQKLIREKYDYIFFTGSQTGGKEIMKIAAETLTPVTLELGGKSPCVVDKSANIKIAARRIVWGKFLNAGQTCVAPDYVWAHRDIKERLLVEMRDCVKQFYGENPVENLSFPRIVNEDHFERLSKLMEGGRLVCGGEKDIDSLRISPTIIDKITVDDEIMQNEIFGPILPVLEFEHVEEVIGMINSKPKPLALYYFGSPRLSREVTASTSAGGVCVNETVMHLTNPKMPFGGVGNSGMGAYHGKYSFDTFTHYKPIMYKSNFLETTLRYPPFTKLKQAIVRFVCR